MEAKSELRGFVRIACHKHMSAVASERGVFFCQRPAATAVAAVQEELSDWQHVQVDLGQGSPSRLGMNPRPTSPSSAPLSPQTHTKSSVNTPLLLLKLATLLWLLSPSTAAAFYNPQAGRWLNRDPVQETGGLNLHSLVNNDPENVFDPLGLVTGTVSVRYWRPVMKDGFFSHKRAWLIQLVWRPPAAWTGLKCPPCSMVIWTQDATEGKGSLERDWGEEDYGDYTTAWEAGKRGSDEALLYDEPGMEGPFLFLFTSPYRFRARSYVKCILGRDFGRTYHEVDWGFTWEYDHMPRGVGPIYSTMDLADTVW
jgi:hypothetical protein